MSSHIFHRVGAYYDAIKYGLQHEVSERNEAVTEVHSKLHLLGEKAEQNRFMNENCMKVLTV